MARESKRQFKRKDRQKQAHADAAKRRAAAAAHASPLRAATLSDVAEAAHRGEASAALAVCAEVGRLPRPHAKAAAELLELAARRSSLLDGDDAGAWVQPVVRLAGLRARFLRPATLWQPRHTEPARLLGQLARVCLARYDPPRFWDEVFASARWEPRWFADVAQGVSLRRLGLPFALNRRAAHALSQQRGGSLPEAARRAQAIGAGGDDALADAVAASALGRGVSADEAIWPGLLAALARVAFLPPAQVGPFVESVLNARRRGQAVSAEPRAVAARLREVAGARVGAAGRRRPEPPRHVAPHMPPGVSTSRVGGWSSSGIGGYRRVRGRRLHEIVELCSAGALRGEGVAMNHCAGGFVDVCAAGTHAVFSYRADGHRRLTIEVNVRHRVVTQARGRGNRAAGPDELDVLRVWASERGLSLGVL